MKITCNISEKEELMEVIAAGCIHIGNGENTPQEARNKKNKLKKTDIRKFKMATSLLMERNIEWELIN